MKVCAIEPLQNRQGKVKVCLSSGTDFVLYRKECLRWNLKEGEELTPEVYDEILQEVLIPRAKRRAMHLLERMDRSAHDLEDKLRDNGYPAEAVQAALAYVISFHYVDDERMARHHIRCYQDSRSRRRLMQDLQKKGIERDVIVRCIEEEYSGSESDQIARLLVKKHYDCETSTREEKAKMYRFLLQRGFSGNDISKALREDWTT